MDELSQKAQPLILTQPGDHLRAVIGHAPMILWMLDAEGIFTFSEGKGLEALGLKPGEVVGRSVYEVYAGHPVILADVQRALGGEESASVVTAMGAWFETRCAPLRAGSGAVIGMVGVALDVTDRQHAEESLARSMSILRATLDSTADGLLVVDRAGRIVTYNRTMRELWRLPEALLDQGLDDDVIAYVLDQLKDPEEFLAKVRQLYAAPEQHSFDVLEFRDGRVFERYSQPQRVGAEVVGRVWSFRDVTEGRRSSEQLERAVEERTIELAETNAALEEEIAERERAEEELRQKTSELEAIFRALPDGYVRLTTDGAIIETKTGSGSGVGLPAVECAGQKLFHVFSRSAAEPLRGALAEVLETGRLARAEYSAKVAGQYRDFEARFVPLSGNEVIAVIRDISDRKEAERALQKSEEHFRLLIENSSDVATILAPDGTNLYQSPSITGVLGYSPGEMVGTRAFDRIHPDDHEHTRTSLRQAAMHPGTSVAVEFRYRHKNGDWRYLEARAKTLLPDSAEGGVVVNSRDVTERHEAEAAMQRREEHFRRLIENGSDLIQIIDPTGVIAYTSPSVTRVLGYAPEEVLGRAVAELIHPDDVHRVETTQRETLRRPGSTRAAEYRVRHKDGSWRVFEGIARTVSPDSAAEGLVANARDITERKSFEEALRNAIGEAELAREAAERANRAKSEFLSRMSHELRTPLNSILGFAQVLSRREIPPDQRKAVDHILKAGRHLLNLINEVLDIARIEANTQEMAMEAVQVRSVVQEALSLIQPLANEHGMRIVECETSAEWHVRADRRRLTQVLLNLLSNAVKYNRPHGTVELLCQERVDEDSDGPKLAIGVRDTGKGIPAGRMSELFTPFARLGAEQTEVEGTGLGLALSQRLVQAMNGALTVESVPGEGSTFTVELPLALNPMDEELELDPQHLPEGAASTAARRPATLLYIEDNLANLALVETILASRPELHLVAALKGEIGLSLAWKHQPDVVLLDLHLPDVQGIDVLRRLRGDPRTAGVPVIVVSADATADSVARLNAEGARMYLTKPIDVDQLVEAVDRILGERAGADGAGR